MIILTILLIIMGGALITARLYSQDSGLYWTPSSLISGEYSIDDGPWIETDVYTPIDKRFHKIVFRGRLVSNTSIVKELAISVKNVWLTLAYDDGELIFSNTYRIEGSDMWNARMNEEALDYLPHT